MWHWHQDRQIHQWSRIDCPEIDPYLYKQIVFDKDAEEFNAERTGFSTKGIQTFGNPYTRK